MARSVKINFATEPHVDGAEPFEFVTRVPSGATLHTKSESVNLIDLRGSEQEAPSLGTEGFELVNLPLAADVDMTGALGWEESYVEQMAEWLRKRLGARQVKSVGHVFRRRDPECTKDIHDQMGNPDRMQPACAAHIDISQARGVTRCLQGVTFDPETERGAVYNIWRPLRGPVVDCPLAICDSQTLSVTDVCETTDIYGGGYYIRYNPKQRWYYAKDQMPHEMLVFRSYDSQIKPKDGMAWGTAHSAFLDTERVVAELGALPRQSIEVRFAVLF